MSATALRIGYSYQEYVRFEREAHDRHEFVGGLILAMAGGSLEHGRLTAVVIGALTSQLGGKPCSVFDSNARVRVVASGNAYYPDASVVCDRLDVDPADDLSMTNPAVLVEVLSPSTADYDRTDKLLDYQRIPSLRHVVHVAQDEARVDVWSRSGDTWSHSSYRPGEKVRIDAIGCVLDVASVYRNPIPGSTGRTRPEV